MGVSKLSFLVDSTRHVPEIELLAVTMKRLEILATTIKLNCLFAGGVEAKKEHDGWYAKHSHVVLFSGPLVVTQ